MWVLLSHKLSVATPSYDMGPGLEIKPFKQIERGDSSNSYFVSFLNHLGTHVDAPLHFDPRGRPIAGFGVDFFVFERPVLVDIPKGVGELITADELRSLYGEIRDADLLMIRTGFQRFRESDVETFSRRGPCLSDGAARYIVEELPKLRAVGVDAISISSPMRREEGRAAHRTLLVGRDFLIIEDMDLMDKPSNIRRVFVMPLLIEGVDSAPCMVLAEV